MGVVSDYDRDPERYRRGMAVTRSYAAGTLYRVAAAVLADLGAREVLDVGCAEGALRAALPRSGPRLIGLDASATMLRAHPPPVVQADASRLPFPTGVFDAVTALNVLYHLPDPRPALREAHRVLRAAGHLVVAVIARDDSPELSGYWTRPRTGFDAEDAPGLLARVFDRVTVHRWDAPLITLPDAAAIRDYLLGRQAPADVAIRAAREIPVPFTVTKRGALIVADRGPGSAPAEDQAGDRAADPPGATDAAQHDH
jgi:SAM-dependent methyltransferase